MKKLISKILNIDINTIESVEYIYDNKDLHIETEYDYSNSYPIITGIIMEPTYSIRIKGEEYPKQVSLSDFLTYISENLIY